MRQMVKLHKLKEGDKVAIVSPSFAAPGKWPHVYDLGIQRIKQVFGLEPVEFPTTRQIGASKHERAKDLIEAFGRPDIKAVIATLGGNDQVMYAKDLPSEPFCSNPKPFFGYSDNSHFANHLWLQGVPSYYGGGVLTQFAMQGDMDAYTVKYLKRALFEEGKTEIVPSPVYNDIGLNWDDPKTLSQRRQYEPNEGWYWDADISAEGLTWGGCLESIDDMLRHNTPIPALEDYDDVILITETSEELPSAEYVSRVYRALGERGILSRIKGVLVGRPKAWEFNNQRSPEEKNEYRSQQREAIISVVRSYAASIPIVQNLDFGHTDPQISIPYGMRVRLDSDEKRVFAQF